jgi:D-lactate dehydrogenase
MTKIIFSEIETWERDELQRLSKDYTVKFVEEPLTMTNVDQCTDADIISPFIYSKLSSDVLKKFKHLKLITTRSTGYDHIDINFCNENGIMVSNVPDYGKNTVAEHVFGLLLSISHKITKAVERTIRGDFSLQNLMGFDLRGKRLGVVGTGGIGLCVIEIAKGFGMEVLAFDVKPKEEIASKLGFCYAPMDKVLSISDIITIHVPAGKSTENLISTDQFNIMKNGVVFINTSRGSVVDIRALVRALAEGKVSAAGLDVLPEEATIKEEAELMRSVYQKKHDLETLLADHILLRLKNVYITPHSAFYTREAMQRILDTTVDNITSFTKNNPKNIVTKE